MTSPYAVKIPVINPNEREVQLASLNITNGMKLSSGDLIAIIESTKSTLEIYAEKPGFVLGSTKHKGDTVVAGDTLCFIVENLEVELSITHNEFNFERQDAKPEGVRITEPALALARESGLDISNFPPDELITISKINAILRTRHSMAHINPTSSSVIIYGGGGHGKSVIELVQAVHQLDIVGIIDDGLNVGDLVLDIPVMGGAMLLDELRQLPIKLAINAVGGIGNIISRLRVYDSLRKAGFEFPTIIHPTAVIEKSAFIKDGAQLFALSYLGSSSKLGFGCIINTGAIISHDCILGDYVNISPGAILAGSVNVEEKVLIGMGVTINLSVRIGAGARIGNGATVKADVPSGAVVKAGSIWPT